MAPTDHTPALSDECILHLWDTHVAYETNPSRPKQPPLTDKDKIAFARAVLAADEHLPDERRYRWLALRQAADQFIASCNDGNVRELLEYYEEIFREALADQGLDATPVVSQKLANLSDNEEAQRG